jgi:hypothetical protein
MGWNASPPHRVQETKWKIIESSLQSSFLLRNGYLLPEAPAGSVGLVAFGRRPHGLLSS